MKNIQAVFKLIRKHSPNTTVLYESRFAELEKLVRNDLIFFPLHFYLEVLQSLGLIKISKIRKGIALTEKGKTVNGNYVAGFKATVILFLLFIKRLFLLLVMFILFWPMYINMERQYNTEQHKEC